MDSLKLENQLCFPLYAAAKEVVNKYKLFLDAIGLTYTQYIVMMVLWAQKEVNITELGARLYLDSGTLTPLLKRLEAKGCLKRTRSAQDERVVIVSITEEGEQLKERAAAIPAQMAACMPLSPDEAAALYALLYKLLKN